MPPNASQPKKLSAVVVPSIDSNLSIQNHDGHVITPAELADSQTNYKASAAVRDMSTTSVEGNIYGTAKSAAVEYLMSRIPAAIDRLLRNMPDNIARYRKSVGKCDFPSRKASNIFFTSFWLQCTTVGENEEMCVCANIPSSHSLVLADPDNYWT